MVAPFYIFPSSIWSFQFLYIFPNTVIFAVIFLAILVGLKWYLIVGLHFLVINTAKHLFMFVGHSYIFFREMSYSHPLSTF